MRGPLLIAHHPFDLADAGQGRAPDLELKGAALIARFDRGTALLDQCIDVLPLLERLPQRALVPGTLDEVPALQPTRQTRHTRGATGIS